MDSGLTVVAEPFSVPANAARHFPSAEQARAQPVGSIHLAWDRADPYLYNQAFDQALVAHDSAYCTTVKDLTGAIQVPTLGHIDRVMRHVNPARQVVDIGCGQGEFVAALQNRGIDAVGYDPVVRNDAPGLVARYWEPRDEANAGLFVTRCVLPHVPEPWRWVKSMGDAHPGALLLVEYQRLEWMAERGVWYQLSHDHVNQFTAADFAARFQVVDQGRFANDEWAWVLVRPDVYRDPAAQDCSVTILVEQLVRARRNMLADLADESVVLWGAAGKGIVLAHALIGAGAHVLFAVDADPSRQGKFMEGSGVRVISPAEARDALHDQILLVCNPNHRDAVEAYTSHTAYRPSVP